MMDDRMLQAGGAFAVTVVVAALGVAQAAEKDVLGWEGARWGMSEGELRKAFAPKVLVSKSADRPGETALATPGYVFLGCPFDATFRLSVSRGLVSIELTQVENLAGHRGKTAGDYEKACAVVDRRLEEKFGPAQERRYEKDWGFPSADITTGGAQAGQVYINFEARPGAKKNMTQHSA